MKIYIIWNIKRNYFTESNFYYKLVSKFKISSISKGENSIKFSKTKLCLNNGISFLIFYILKIKIILKKLKKKILLLNFC